MKIGNWKLKVENARAFTLIELLVVISIIGVLAAFTLGGLKSVKASQYKRVARAELEQLQTALENYKAKYGAYPPANKADSLLSQLYYELSGTSVTKIGGVDYCVTLDGSAQIPVASVPQAYGVGGFMNCTKGSGEDAASAKNFLPSLNPRQLYSPVTNNSYGFNIPTTVLVTSVGGPDEKYQPLKATGLNPFRYAYPGTNNPNSYDLWVQIVINGKTNLICNWSRQIQINSPLP